VDKMKSKAQCPADISDNDIFSAMKLMNGYIDITPADFKEIYKIAYQLTVERLYQNFKASDVMTHPVIFVQTDTSLLKTADLMAEHNISGVPVVATGQYVAGVISEKDFLCEMTEQCHLSFMGVVAHCLNNEGHMAVSLQYRHVADIMSVSPICVHENTTITQISDIFENNNINRVPVIDKKEKLTGIVTRSDIIQHFCTIPEITERVAL